MAVAISRGRPSTTIWSRSCFSTRRRRRRRIWKRSSGRLRRIGGRSMRICSRLRLAFTREVLRPIGKTKLCHTMRMKSPVLVTQAAVLVKRRRSRSHLWGIWSYPTLKPVLVGVKRLSLPNHSKLWKRSAQPNQRIKRRSESRDLWFCKTMNRSSRSRLYAPSPTLPRTVRKRVERRLSNYSRQRVPSNWSNLIVVLLLITIT